LTVQPRSQVGILIKRTWVIAEQFRRRLKFKTSIYDKLLLLTYAFLALFVFAFFVFLVLVFFVFFVSFVFGSFAFVYFVFFF